MSTVCTAADTAHTQTQVVIDLGYRPDLVWRGLTRVERPGFQPSAVVGYSTQRWMISAGGWMALEPFHSQQAATLAGRDRLLGEIDYWLQIDHRFGANVPLDVAAGVNLYRFHGDPAVGGMGSGFDTEEVYVSARVPELERLVRGLGDFPLAVELPIFFDIDLYEGVYLEPALQSDMPVLFLGEPWGSLILRTALGMSWGMDGDLERVGYYQRDGATHLDLSAAVSPFVSFRTLGLTIYFASHLQIGLDPATIEAPSGSAERIRGRGELVVSLLAPVRRKP